MKKKIKNKNLTIIRFRVELPPITLIALILIPIFKKVIRENSCNSWQKKLYQNLLQRFGYTTP